MLSWFAAVIVIPYLGYKLLPEAHQGHGKPSLLARLSSPFTRFQHRIAERFYVWFRGLIRFCVRQPVFVIVLTLAVFVGSIFLFQLVQKQFFPDARVWSLSST